MSLFIKLIPKLDMFFENSSNTSNIQVGRLSISPVFGKAKVESTENNFLPSFITKGKKMKLLHRKKAPKTNKCDRTDATLLFIFFENKFVGTFINKDKKKPNINAPP